MFSDIFFMVCSKLEAKAIYVVKQACGHVVNGYVTAVHTIKYHVLNLFSGCKCPQNALTFNIELDGKDSCK